MRYILSAAALFCACILSAQSFVKNTTGRALTFKEVQLQFDAFKKTHDLNSSKYWKSFKRYEAEMVLHTNGRGEPDGFSSYIEEAIRSADEKNSRGSAAGDWSPTGPTIVPENRTFYMENGIGRVNCVAFHPSDTNTYYVGVAQGGLWKTTNGGASYTPLTDNLPITRISDICIVPNNPHVIYISVCDFEYVGKGLYYDGKKRHTHFGIGVYKSVDGGQTWSATGLTFQLTNGDASLIRKIVVNPMNTSELLACGVSGMYKSANGGTTWTKKLDSLFWDMEQSPATGTTVYAATGWIKNAGAGHAAIYKSTDFGNTWIKLSTTIPMQGSVQRIELAIAPSNSNYVYALCVDDQDGFYGLYRSTNAGGNWTYQSGSVNILSYDEGFDAGGQGTYDLALCVDKSDENTIYTGGINIWGSSDGGVSFFPVSHWTYQYGFSTVHADIHAIAQQPGSGDFFVACDGGLYTTSKMEPGNWIDPWTTEWTNRSNGMQVTSFYRISSSKDFADRLAAGAQDNATFYKTQSGWSTIFGGDGMDNYLSPGSMQHVLGSSQYGKFYITTDDGFSTQPVFSNPYMEPSEWVAPVVADYNNPGVVYVGNENIVKSTDHGETWTPLATIYSNLQNQSSTEISALAVSPTNSLVLYAARRVRHELGMKGFVFITSNGGQSFVKITSNLPDSLFYTGIEVSYETSSEAVICMAGFAAGQKVYKTTNSGTSWTNISYNLPNVPVNCIKYIEGTNQLMVATDVGIFVLNKNETTWVKYSNGLPNVITTDIEINPVTQKIYIATFGRGIWETDLQSVKNLQPTDLKDNSSIDFAAFKAYPSVSGGRITIESPSEKALRLDVIDVMGRLIYSTAVNSSKTTLDLPLIQGAYYLRLGNGRTHGVQKIVIQ